MFNITRNEQLTLESLKVEVAWLMGCSPRQLLLVASDIDMDLERQSTTVESRILTSRANHLHFRFVDSVDDFEEVEAMEGVQYVERRHNDAPDEVWRAHWQDMFQARADVT